MLLALGLVRKRERKQRVLLTKTGHPGFLGGRLPLAFECLSVAALQMSDSSPVASTNGLSVVCLLEGYFGNSDVPAALESVGEWQGKHYRGCPQ